MSRTYRNRIARRKIKRKHRRPRKSSRNNIKALIKNYEISQVNNEYGIAKLGKEVYNEEDSFNY